MDSPCTHPRFTTATEEESTLDRSEAHLIKEGWTGSIGLVDEAGCCLPACEETLACVDARPPSKTLASALGSKVQNMWSARMRM